MKSPFCSTVPPALGARRRGGRNRSWAALMQQTFGLDVLACPNCALEMALKRRCPGLGLLHHSDQGSTSGSEDYQDVLSAYGITCSMSRRGNCYDTGTFPLVG
jgi:hypothetical protein